MREGGGRTIRHTKSFTRAPPPITNISRLTLVALSAPYCVLAGQQWSRLRWLTLFCSKVNRMMERIYRTISQRIPIQQHKQSSTDHIIRLLLFFCPFIFFFGKEKNVVIKSKAVEKAPENSKNYISLLHITIKRES